MEEWPAGILFAPGEENPSESARPLFGIYCRVEKVINAHPVWKNGSGTYPLFTSSPNPHWKLHNKPKDDSFQIASCCCILPFGCEAIWLLSSPDGLNNWSVRVTSYDAHGDDPVIMKLQTTMSHAADVKQMGNTYVSARSWEQALHQYSECLEILSSIQGFAMPDEMKLEHKTMFTDTLCNSALCHMKKEQWKLAGEHALRCLEIEPMHVKAMYRFAFVCEQKGDYGIASHYVHQALHRWDEKRYGSRELGQELAARLELISKAGDQDNSQGMVTVCLSRAKRQVAMTYTSPFGYKNYELAEEGFRDNALLEIQEMEKRYGEGRYNIGHLQGEIHRDLAGLPTEASLAEYIVELVRRKASARIQIAWSWVSNRMPSVTESKMDGEFSMEVLRQTHGLSDFFDIMKEGDLCGIECVLRVLKGYGLISQRLIRHIERSWNGAEFLCCVIFFSHLMMIYTNLLQLVHLKGWHAACP